MSVIMAFILNDIVVEFADRAELKNISNNSGQEKYDIRVSHKKQLT